MLDSSSLPLVIVLSINSLTAPSFGTPAQTFTLATFDSNSNSVQFDNSSVVFNNNCSLSCKTCLSTNSSACLSCYTPSTLNLTLLYGETCVSSCPSNSFQQNLTCIACDSSCLTCSNTQTNCLSCNTSNNSSPYFYFNVSTSTGSCLATCGFGTYLDNATCQDCHSTCTSCNSTSFCF